MNVDFIAKQFPYLKTNLLQARMELAPEEFIKKVLLQSLIVSLTLTISALFVLIKLKVNAFFIVLILPCLYFLVFFFLMNSIKSKANKIIREIDSEIVYAGRFLLIEISAGVPLYDAVKNVALHYAKIGKYFQDIIDKVEIGKPIEQALNEVIENTPSTDFRKLLWQISNALKTGGDIVIALESIIEQISQEQLIKVKEYGKKLNPLVMFYLLIAVIAPSLGIAILSLLSTFVGFSLSLANLIAISFVISLLQMSFLITLHNLRRL